jgi:hypothetical protein
MILAAGSSLRAMATTPSIVALGVLGVMLGNVAQSVDAQLSPDNQKVSWKAFRSNTSGRLLGDGAGNSASGLACSATT